MFFVIYLLGVIVTAILFYIVKVKIKKNIPILFEDLTDSPTFDMLIYSLVWPFIYGVMFVTMIVVGSSLFIEFIDTKVFGKTKIED